MEFEKVFNSKFLLNLLISLLPLAFILGNFAINVELTLISIVGIVILKGKLLNLDFKLEKVVLYSFFILLIISTFFNLLFSEDYNLDQFLKDERTTKSILFLRYIIFALIINKLIEKNLINLKNFFYSSLICCLFVSLDVILQYFSGTDIFGYEGTPVSKSGPFGDELIAGGYLGRFFLFSIIGIQILIFKNENQRKLLTLFFSFICVLSIFYSGNKMPFLLVLLSIIFLIFFLKNLRLPILFGTILALLIAGQSLKHNNDFKIYYTAFYVNLQEIPKQLSKKLYIENFGTSEEKQIAEKEIWSNRTGHRNIYLSAIDVWKDKKLLGGGIRSFRNNCSKTLHRSSRMCESHPHNYYLEFLTDTGILGLILISILVISLILKFSKILIKNNSYKENLVLAPLYIYLLVEFFPFKSSGSFFGTYNASLIFFIIGIFLSEKFYLLKK